MALISVTISGNAAPLRNALNDSESALGKFGKVASVGLAAAATGFVALGVAAGSALKGAIEVEAQQNRLRQILKTTGAATEEQVDSLLRQADALEKVGVASASSIVAAQSQLATFDLQAETIERLTPAITDYVIAEKGATATSEDFKSMTNALAQALQGNFGALTKSGFVLDETTKEMIKNGTEAERSAALVEVLGSTYEGFNESAGKTTEGQLIMLRNAFGAVKDEIGLALLPVFKGLVEIIQNAILPALEKTIAFLGGPFAERVGEIGNKILPLVRDGFDLWVSIIQDKVIPAIQDFLIPAFLRIREIFLESIVPAIKTIAVPIFEGLVRIFDIIVSKLRENRERFVQYFDTLRTVWQFIRDKVAPVIGVTLRVAFEIAAKAIGFLLDAFFKILPVFTSIVNGVVKIASRMVDIIVGMVNGVISSVNLLIRGFMSLPSFLRFGIDISEIPKISLTGAGAVGGVGGGGDSFGPSYGMFPGAGTVVSPIVTGGFPGGGLDDGGGDGAGGSGGGSRSTRKKPEATNVTVNVNTPLATKAEIGDAVIQAIRASNAIYGPFIASAF